VPLTVSAADDGLTIAWDKKMLTISGASIPGETLPVWYMEAYCRPGSTDRDWHETVIKHTSVKVGGDDKTITLKDTLEDGVVVEHVIEAGKDAVTFTMTARNPTDKVSEAHWVQPCIRLDKFTGCPASERMDLVPSYARKSFIFLDGKPAMLPTKPWAEKARYVPGQVYCPAHVDRDDVNPRPLSKLVPSNGLIGCYSADNSMILATAWEPYQELFQGIITCLHNDPRIGGLKPGETKVVKGKIYIMKADLKALQARYEKDFPKRNQP
jgi:hypothetical protein